MNSAQKQTPLQILLADDDPDDCFFSENALKELPINTHLTVVCDGEQLMNYLLENISGDAGTNIVFLDLSMPRNRTCHSKKK